MDGVVADGVVDVPGMGMELGFGVVLNPELVPGNVLVPVIGLPVASYCVAWVDVLL